MDTIRIKIKKATPELQGKVLNIFKIDEGVYACKESGEVVFDWKNILNNIKFIHSWTL